MSSLAPRPDNPVAPALDLERVYSRTPLAPLHLGRWGLAPLQYHAAGVPKHGMTHGGMVCPDTA